MTTAQNSPAFDFGAPVSVITDPAEFAELPNEVAERRASISQANLDLVKGAPGAAQAAIEAEVHFGKLSFVFEGDTYWVDSPDEWDLEVFEAQEMGRLVTMVREVVGQKQYEHFKSQPNPEDPDGPRIKRKRVLADLTALLDAATAAGGTSVKK